MLQDLLGRSEVVTGGRDGIEKETARGLWVAAVDVTLACDGIHA